MNLRQLEILRAVILCRTSVDAAKRLGLSQPAVSNAIKRIESQLGFALFDRVGGRLIPTEEAKLILYDSESIFSTHRALLNKLANLKEDKNNQLSIITTPALGTTLFPQIAARFMSRRPQLRLHFDVRPFDVVFENIERSIADIGFVIGPWKHEIFNVEPIAKGNMVCVMNRKHRLCKNKEVTVRDLRNESVVAIDYSTPLGGAILEIFMNSGETIVPRVQTQHTTTACALVENEVGVAVVDPFVVNAVQHPNLRVKPFTPATTAIVYAIWPKSKPLSRISQAFLREVKSSFDGSKLFCAEQVPFAPQLTDYCRVQ